MKLLLFLSLLTIGFSSQEAFSKGKTLVNSNFYRPGDEIREVDYLKEVKPIFDARCATCHSCYNSPCQLKLTSYKGYKRGIIEGEKVYNPNRGSAVEPTPLDWYDHLENPLNAWRRRGGTKTPGRMSPKVRSKGSFTPIANFKPVDNDDQMGLAYNRAFSYIYRLNKAKKSNPSKLPLAYSEESHTCPNTIKKLDKHLTKNPSAGMPYGLPPLSPKNRKVLYQWAEKGSKGPSKAELEFMNQPNSIEDHLAIKRWEDWLNKKSAEEKLVSRYIFEHLFLAHIYFNKNKKTDFYKLVRSRNQCDKGINLISTRRPWDLPKDIKSFYYCFQKITDTIVFKTHIVYNMELKKMNRFNQLFFPKDKNGNPTWWITHKTPKAKIKYFKHVLDKGRKALDGDWWDETIEWYENLVNGYNPKEKDGDPTRIDKVAANPFLIFEDIPAKARYQFMLDDAQYFVTTFIRGPVCKGSAALNSIDEQSFVFFLSPNADPLVNSNLFYSDAMPFIELPAAIGSDPTMFVDSPLASYAPVGYRKRTKYREIREKYVNALLNLKGRKGFNLDDIWNGTDKLNPDALPNKNASLTVLRHFDSAAVVQGPVGATSKTVLLLDYSLIERFYYNLAAAFDVYGDLNHQMLTRLYMNFIRMEAEEMFLSFLPQKSRKPIHNYWYRESEYALEGSKDYFYGMLEQKQGTEINFTSTQPLPQKNELIRKIIKDRLTEKVTGPQDSLGFADKINGDKKYGELHSGINISPITDIKSLEENFRKVVSRPQGDNPYVGYIHDLSIILVRESSDKHHLYSMARNKAHLNIAWIFSEDQRRELKRDTLIIRKQILGPYPNYMYDIKLSEAQEFLKAMSRINNEKAYEKFIYKYGRPRYVKEDEGQGVAKFWKTFDDVTALVKKEFPIYGGLLDLSRYEIDYRANDIKPPENVKGVIKALSK